MVKYILLLTLTLKLIALNPYINYQMEGCWDDDNSTYRVIDSGLAQINSNALYGAYSESNYTVQGGLCSVGNFIGRGQLLPKEPISLNGSYTITFWAKFPLLDDNHKKYCHNSPNSLSECINPTDSYEEYYTLADIEGGNNSFIFFKKEVSNFINESWSWNLGDNSKAFTPPSTGWHMLAFVANNANSRTTLYIDGIEDSAISSTIGNIKIDRLFASDSNETTQTVGTYIDEFKIFNEPLSQSEIIEIYNNERGGRNWRGDKKECHSLVLEYRMDDCNSSALLLDTSRNNLDARLEGNRTATTGLVCRASRFDGYSEGVVPANSKLELGCKLTYMGWIKLKEPTQQTNSDKLENIFTNQRWDNALRFTENGHWNGGGQKILFQLNVDGKSKYLYSNRKITDSNWHHIVALYDGNRMRLYIDGVSDSSLSVKGKLEYGATRSVVAGEYEGGYHFVGDIDEFKVFKGALNSDEIAKIYQNELTGKNYDGKDRVCFDCNSSGYPFNVVNSISSSECNASLDWDNNITTLIVNKPTTLYILSRDVDTKEPLEANITKVVANYYNQGDYLGCIGDIYGSQTLCKNCGNTDKNGCLELNTTFNRAIKCVELIISGEIDKIEQNGTATDNFAIRPDSFKIESSSSNLKAGESFKLNLFAKDINGSDAINYNEPQSNIVLEANESKKGCINGEFRYKDFNFSDGKALNIDANYSEVGRVIITLKERKNSEFANVDIDDTPDDKRFIKEATTTIDFTPHHFNIEANLSNYNKDGNFTYLYDKPIYMNAELKVAIEAKNSINRTLNNYIKECYANDIFIKINHSSIKEGNLSRLKYALIDANSTISNHSIDKNEPIEFFYSRNNFSTENSRIDTNGTTRLNLLINFDRRVDSVVNPFNFKIYSIEVQDSSTEGKLYNIESNATFLFGRFFNYNLNTSKDISSIDTYNLFYDSNRSYINTYEVIPFWWLNKREFKGVSGGVLEASFNSSLILDSKEDSSKSGINININPPQGGIIKIDITNTLKSEAKRGVIHLNIPPWLWYSPTKKEYSYELNSSCINHPCIFYRYVPNEIKQSVISGKFRGSDFNISKGNRKKGIKIFR